MSVMRQKRKVCGGSNLDRGHTPAHHALDQISKAVINLHPVNPGLHFVLGGLFGLSIALLDQPF